MWHLYSAWYGGLFGCAATCINAAKTFLALLSMACIFLRKVSCDAAVVVGWKTEDKWFISLFIIHVDTIFGGRSQKWDFLCFILVRLNAFDCAIIAVLLCCREHEQTHLEDEQRVGSPFTERYYYIALIIVSKSPR